MESKSVEDKK
jgi:hypothetical protein